MSGRSPATSSRASAPVRASPTTSKPGMRWTTSRWTRATMKSSSTTSTRTGTTGSAMRRLVHVQLRAQDRAAAVRHGHDPAVTRARHPGQGQAEAVPLHVLPDLGGEAGLEDPLHIAVRDARAAVAHL